MLDDVIEVINSTVEEYYNPSLEASKVDIIISEPLGNFLFNERMLESFLIARDKYLKKDGKMFPSYAEFCSAPFSDHKLYDEMVSKVESLWKSTCFLGCINFTSMLGKAMKDKMKTPFINAYDPKFNVGFYDYKIIDFRTIKVKELAQLDYKFKYIISKPAVVHGFGFWFNAVFCGSENEVVLSTSPFCASTHWYQIRLFISKPIGVNPGEELLMDLKCKANTIQTYDIAMDVELPSVHVYL